MNNLSRCLLKHSKDLKDFDTGEVVEAAQVYVSRGKTEDQANAEAIEDHLDDLRTQRNRIAALVIEQFKAKDPAKFAQIEAKAKGLGPAPKAAPAAAPAVSEKERGIAMAAEGIDELISLLGGKTNLMPEEEARIIPVMSKIFRGAAIAGYATFKDAARWVYQQIHAKSPAVAEKLSIENLQAGYINIAKEIGGDKRAALDFDSIEQLMAAEPDANPEIEAAAHAAATSPLNNLPQPTDKQKEVGNYRVGKVRVQGLDISIENPRGSVRSGTSPDGKKWQNTLAHHYGYIKGTTANDGDHLDIFLTNGAETAGVVWVIDQKNKDGSFDEHKIVLGPTTESEARAAYLANYAPGWDGIGAITSMPVEAFKSWASDGKAKRNPLAYVEAQKPKTEAAGERQPTIADLNSGKSLVDGIKSEIAKWVANATQSGAREMDRKWERGAVKRFIDAHIKAHLDGKQIGNRAAAKIAVAKSETFAALVSAVEKMVDPVAPEKAGAGATATTEDSSGVDYGGDSRAIGIAIGRVHAAQQNVGNSANTRTQQVDRAELTSAIDNAKESGVTVDYSPRVGEGSESWLLTTPAGNRYRVYLSPAGRGNWIALGKNESSETAPDRHENATAPEHIKDDTGVTVAELKQIAKVFREAVDSGADAEVTHVFDAPLKGEIVNLEKKAGITAKNEGGKRVYHRDAGWMTPEEAKAHIEQWKAHARAQNDTQSDNWTKVVLSLFDKSGAWSEPWEAAGYQVYRFDIQNNETNTIYDEETGEEREINTGDINEFSVGYFADLYGAFDGNDVYAVLAACPCTDFAVSGARHFAAKDYDGRTVASIKLVKATLATIEYFKPPIWALENPVGRIEELTGLPPWRLSFDPNHFGDPYTKKTLLWGRFNADLPVAPVEPTEGSKMHSQYGGKSQATKDARSVTPEGFAYSFFMANNAADHPALAISGKYDRLDRDLIEKAVKAGIKESEIDSAVEDFYYQELNDDAANAAIRDLIEQNPTPKGGLPAVQQQLFVEFGGQTFPVESLRDASEKWERFRDETGVGSSEVDNLRILDQNGKQIAYVSYNGRVWPGKDYNADAESLYDPRDQRESALPQEREVSEDTPAKDGPRFAIGQRVTIVSGKFAGTGAVVGAHFPVPGNVDTGESVDYALTMDGGKGGAVMPEAFIKAESAGEIADAGAAEKQPTSQWLHDDIVLLIDQKGRTKDRKALNKVVELLKQRMDGEDVRAARVKTYTIKFKREPKIAEIMDRVIARLETEDREATAAKRRANKQAKEGQNGTETTQAEPQPQKQPPAIAAPSDAAVAAPNTGFVEIGVSPDGVAIWANAAGTRQRREGGVVIGEMLRAGGEDQKPSWDRYQTKEEAAARSETAAAKLNEKDVTADKELATLILNAADTGSRMYGQGVANRLYGPDAESARQTILSALTGEKVPKSKAGHKATMQALYDRFGVMPDAIVTMQREIDRKLSEATGKAVAQEGAEETAVEAADPEFDERGNPVRRVGDRVEATGGQYVGRHGEVTDVNKNRMVAIGLGRGVKSEWTTYHYNVRSDNGTEFYASPDQLKTEESRPESVVMDPVVNGRAMEPEALHRSIGYDRQSAQNFRAKAQRARKSSAIAEHKRAAERSDASAVEKQAIWDEWAAKNPAEAEKIAPKPAAKAPQATPQDAAAAATPVDAAGAVRSAGLVVTKTTTKNDKPVWEVSGNTRDHSDMLKSLGGRWYGPKKVWSFYNDDPSIAIAEKLGGASAQVLAPQIELGAKEVMLPGNPYVYRKEASGGWTWRSGNGNPSPLGAATLIIGQLEAALAAKNPVILGQPAEKVSDKALEALVDAETPTGEKARAETEARAAADEPDIGAIFDNALDELFGDKPVVATPGPWQTVLIKAGTPVRIEGEDYTVRNDYTEGHRGDGEPVSLRTSGQYAKVVDKPYEAVGAALRAGEIMAEAKAKKKIINPTTPEGYAAALADPAILDQYQDELDAYFQERLIAVRNALRDLGWVRQGNATGDPLEKDGKAARFSFRYAGGGAKNVVGMTVNDVEDKLTLTPAKFAELADKTAGLTRARQDLDDMQARHQKQGNFADDRLAGQIRRHQALIEEYKVAIAALDPVKVGAGDAAATDVTGKIENAKRRLRETRNEIEQVSGGVSDANRKKTADLRAKESEIEREIRGLRQQALEQDADGQNDELDAEMQSYEAKAGAAPAFGVGDWVDVVDANGKRTGNGRYLGAALDGSGGGKVQLADNMEIVVPYDRIIGGKPKKPVTPQVAAPAGSTPLGAKPESKEDVERFERAMRNAAGWQYEDGDVQTTALRWVPFDKALEIAREAVSAGVKPVPAQFHTRLDVTMDSADRLIAALEEKPRTAGEAATSAAKNAAMGLKDVAKGLNALFKPKPGTLGMAVFGAPFDEETYAAAKPLFMAGIAHFRQAGADIGEMVKALLKHLMDQSDEPMERVTLEAMKPYIVKFIGDVKAGKVVYDENEEVANNGSERDTDTNAGEGNQGSGDWILGTAGQADQAGMGDQPAANVVAPGDAGVSERPGAGTSDGNVGSVGSVSEGGNAANGRPGTGGNGVVDAGAGGRKPGKRPVGSSDGSDQQGQRPTEGSRAEVANYHIADPEQLIGGTPKVRFARNRKAIEALQAITAEGRPPQQDELDAMAGYIGWGSFGQDLFQGTFDRPKPKAGWEKESDWLREHLGKEAWESAQASIINAHYTDPITVSTMWSMVRQMGFTGGRVLEPSMGVGNFFGLMPRDLMARSILAGIEMDTTTGGMAKLLYPDANIQIKPYQDSKTADGFYDLVIGNWPFAKDGPADRRYLKLSPSLHDFFFLKALDQTRPGGLVVGITSAGTMDKQGSLTRAALAEKADLVAAFRLPTGAFEKYAGTSVVTDIIILKKRETQNADVRNSGWLTTIEVDTPSGNKVKVNQYFARKPGNVLGTLNFGHGTTYGRPAMIVDRPVNLEARMDELAATLPEGVFEPATTKAKTIQYVTNNTKDRQQSIITQGGKLFQVQGEYLAPLHEVYDYRVKDSKKTADREAQLVKLIDLRRKHGALIDADRDGLEDAETRRKALNDAYKAFTKAHGSLGDSEGMAIMRRLGDPFFAPLAALEVGGKPAAILSSATMRTKKKLENPSVRDALIMMRNESVFVDIGRIADLSGVSVDVAAKELTESGAIFLTPDGTFDVSDVYLSGNVRRKLREAEAAAEAGMNMERNIEALGRVVPADIPYFNIEAKLGATWIPVEHYKQFIEHMLGTNSDGIEARFVINRWKVRFTDRQLNNRPEAKTTWGAEGIHFDKLIAHAMGNMAVKIWGKDADGNKVINEDLSEKANEKANKIREEFGTWLWSDPARKIEMERAYNESMNAIAIPSFDGSFMGFEGMALRRGNSPFDMRSHQGNAVYRGLVNRRGIYAHEVGTGKTYTMGALAVESRRYGIAKKPLIFAHNANSSSVAREIGEQYPGAKLLYIDNLAPDRIDVTLRQIANDEWDAIVVPHSLINRFSLKEETLMEISRHQIEALEQEAIEAANDDGIGLTVEMMNDEDAMKKVRSVTAKQLVHGRNQIIKMIKEMALKSSKEGAVSFEDMGIDMVIVDEAHEFKKPPLATRMSMKGLNKTASAQSISLMLLTDYVKKLNGGTGVHVFTGTPITNTMNEIYNMMRFVMDDQMSRDGIREWDAWFNTFADQTSDVELTPAGEYEPVSRLAAFVNVPELRRMAGQYMDIVFADDMPEFKPRVTKSGKTLTSENLTDAERDELLNGRTENPIGRPYKKVINDVGEMSPEQVAIFDELKQRAASFKAASKKERKEIMLSGDNRNPVIVETAAANAGLDARLYDIEASDSPENKVNRVAKNVVAHYKEHDQATQVIFVDKGYTSESVSRKKDRATGQVTVVKKPRFNLVRDIVAKLTEQGIPLNQIAIVDGGVSKEKRKEIADAMNLSKIRVVIGLTDTLGVGVNMQANLRAMHHLDAPWMPGELEQRNGRGHRQGNAWNTVLEYRYITERIDGRRWQVLSIKDRFIKQFLKADDSIRVIEGDAVSLDEDGDLGNTLSDAAGDPRLLMINKLRSDVQKLENRERMHAQGIFDARRAIVSLGEKIKRVGKALEAYRKDFEKFKAVAKDDLVIEVAGRRFTDVEKANEVMELVASKVAVNADPIEIAKLWGFLITAAQPVSWRGIEYQINGAAMHQMGKPTIESARATMYGIAKRVEGMEADIAEWEGSIPRMEESAKAPFSRSKDLEKKRKMLADTESDIQRNPVPAPSWLRNGAPSGTEAFVDGKPLVIEGHRYTNEGYFVTVSDGDMTRDVPYMEVMDENGLPKYEEHTFVAPKIIKAEDKGVKDGLGRTQTPLEPGWYRVTDDKGVKEATDRNLTADQIKELVGHGYTLQKARQIDVSNYLYRSYKFRGEQIVEVVERAPDVAIDKMPDHKFFAFKDDKIWHVIESSTGISVGRGDTKKEAIDTATASIENNGVDRVLARIEELKLTEQQKRNAVNDYKDKEGKNTAQSPEAGYNDPYDNLETRPGTVDDQLREGRDASRSIERAVFGDGVDRVRGGGPTILGLAISKDFREDGGTSFTGKQVSNPRDLALLAQVVRDPRFETVRIFYTRGDSIVGQAAMSSRLPAVVYLTNNFADNVAEGKARFNADGYWMVHNHPNGSSEPSKADEALTGDTARNVPGFRGHVIIDHNEYSTIEVDPLFGATDVRIFKDATLGSANLLENPAVPNRFLGEALSAPAMVKDMARAMQVKDGFVVIVGVDSLNKVRVITELPDVATKSMSRGESLRNLAMLRKMRTAAGLSRLFAIVPGDYNDPRYRDMLNSGLFTDVVGSNGAAAERGVGNLLGEITKTSTDRRRGGTPWFVEDPAYHDGTPHTVDRLRAPLDRVGDSSEVKSLPDGMVADAKSLADLVSTESFAQKGLRSLNIPAQTLQLGRVRRLIENDKIRRVVVESIPVDMMNFLGRQELTPKMLLHDVSMFLDLFPVNGNDLVSTNVDTTSRLANVVAIAAAKVAKLPIPDATGFPLEQNSAMIAGDGDSSLSAFNGAMNPVGAASRLEGGAAGFANNGPHGGLSGKNDRYVIPENERIVNSGIFDDADITITAMESRGTIETTDASPAEIRRAFVKAFGESVVRAQERAGLIEILPDAAALRVLLPGVRISNSAKALFFGDRAYFIADRMNPATAHREALHEIGEHYGLKRMLGNDGYRALVNRVKAMRNAGDDYVSRAWNFVVREYIERESDPGQKLVEGSDRFMHEVMAQIGQNADVQKAPWWKALIADVRRWLVKTFGFTSGVSSADIQDMVLHSLKTAARPNPSGPGGGIRGSRMANTAMASAAPRFGAADTSSPEFKAWFGDSKVVDAEGNPLVVYHGTVNQFNTFLGRHRNSAQFPAEIGATFFTSDKEMARGYAGGSVEPMSLYLSLQNPHIMEADGDWWIGANFKAINAARKGGHDGVIIRNVIDTAAGQSQRPIDVYITFRPEQIKSAISNTGEFDPANADIRYSQRGPWYYSALADTIPGMAKIADKQGTVSPEQAKAWLQARQKEGKFKADELNWSGVLDWLDMEASKPVVEPGFGVVEEYRDAKGGEWEQVDDLGSYHRTRKEAEAALADMPLGKPDDPWFENRLAIREWPELDFGKRGARVAVADIERFVRENGVRVEEVTLGLSGLDEGEGLHVAPLSDDENGEWAVFRGEEDDPLGGTYESQEAAFRALDAMRGERPTAFGRPDLVLPGGENYRELLIMLPPKEVDEIIDIGRGPFEVRQSQGKFYIVDRLGEWGETPYDSREAAERDFPPHSTRVTKRATSPLFESRHFPATPNILAHVRFNERTDANGKRVLFLEEIQSDWAQKGRKDGFNTPVEMPDGTTRTPTTGVPPAPFVTDTKSWTALALKRMIAHAVENGFDSIAWTTGEQQSDRYDLSKQVSRVEVSRPQDGSYAIYAYKHNTDTVPVIQTRVNSKEELADLLGKEFSEKAAKQLVGTKRDYTGLDLKVGGEGMKGYYDQIVPQVAKKLGAEIGTVTIETEPMRDEGPDVDTPISEDGLVPRQQPGFTITDAMREKALAGLPLFSKGSAALQRSGKNLVGDDVSLLHVLDIESLQAFTVIDTKTRQPLGAVTLGFDAGGDIAMLADIQAYDKGAGIGSRILDAVLETAPEDVYIVNMLPDAVGFWQKKGVRLDENYSTEWRSGNGFLGTPRRGDAQRGRATEVARDAAGSRAQGNGASEEGQDQLESRGNFIDGESAAFLRNNRPAPVDRISSIIRNPDRWFQPVLDGAVGSLRGSSLFGALDRSVHTQLHKAQKNPYFGAVFNRLQHFMADSSRAALRPAELAPTVLPRIDVAQSIRPAFEALIKGKAAAADIDAAFQVALAGTLNDTVYRDADEAGLTPEQFRVYREYRDSIDASLDELAAGEAWRIARTLFLNDRNRLTPEGQAMKKRMLDDPTEAAGSLSGFISRELDAATLRAQQLAAVARERTPFLENTGDDLADMKKGLRGDGSVQQDDAMRRAIEAIERANALRDTAERVGKIFSRATQLQGEGYAPLMRFGQHYLTVTRLDPISGEPELNDDGEKVVEYFSLFESAAERDKAEREMRELYGEDPSVEFDAGTMSEKAWERYQGVSPESLALFAENFNVEIGEAFQQYYRVAASTRSTLKRLIHRKGTPGFSTDGSRVLASFLTSNGRRAATLYHEGDIQEALSGFPKQMGREQDEAIELVRYVMDNPNEEAAAPRALMFMHFLGGTVSNFIINATQPAMVTLPYLSKTVGMTRAMALLKEAYGIRNKPEEMSAELRGALERADQEGKVGAQEIHHLWQETARPIISKLGRFGDAVTYRAHAFMQLWGMPFAVAELMNRQVTFISAYNAAKESGKTPNQAYSSAIRAVDETQFIYGKQNRPNWARGTWGSLIFTFKLFSISYTELLVRLAREGAEGRKAALYMLGMLFLAAGAQGMPGADDLDDLIDTLAQMMGYNTSMKLSKRQFLERMAGKEFAGFAMHGLSALTPLDVSGRMSLGNLLPATDLLKPSNSKKESALLEIMGPVGGLATSYLNTADAVATGNWRRASTEWLPKAFKDLAQGAEMMASGEAKDTHGRRVTEVSPVEAAVKMIGFNPQAIAEVGRNARAVQQTISLATRTKGVITEKWARGIVDRNPEDVAAAKRDIESWNAANPETPITIKLSAVALRANAMRATKEDRFIKAATKEMKDYVKEAI